MISLFYDYKIALGALVASMFLFVSQPRESYGAGNALPVARFNRKKGMVIGSALSIFAFTGTATVFWGKWLKENDVVEGLEAQFRKDIGSKKIYLALREAIEKQHRYKNLTIIFFVLAGICGIVYATPYVY